MDHYIGIDVGTGSARACIIDSTGDIKALATENIALWQPETGYYVSCLGDEFSSLYLYRCLTTYRNNPPPTSGDVFVCAFKGH